MVIDGFAQTGPLATDGFGAAADPAPAIALSGSAILGQHLRAKLTLYGPDFTAGAAAVWGQTFDAAVACDRLTLIYGGHDAVSCPPGPPIGLSLRTPLCDREGQFYLWLQAASTYVWSDPIAFTVSGAGYRILRALLAPGRYTADPSDPGNVVLAALGHRLDRLESSRRALVNDELFPETADALLWRHEAEFSIATNLADTIDNRRARVLAARNAQPRITIPSLFSLLAPYQPSGPTTPIAIAENGPYDYQATEGGPIVRVFGDLVWQCQADEPSVNYLAATDWRYLSDLLRRRVAAWTRCDIGHNGFVVDESEVNRDFA